VIEELEILTANMEENCGKSELNNIIYTLISIIKPAPVEVMEIDAENNGIQFLIIHIAKYILPL
jgi:hypothetical protein